MKTFREKFKPTQETRILDIGGTPFNWTLIPDNPKLFLVNLTIPKDPDPRFTWIIADGKNLPFKNHAFDIAYSNSVIEHLGTYENQVTFAQEFTRIASRYYLQTPNKWFFFEPHFITPLIHWVPKNLRKKLLRNFTIWGWIARPSPQTCEKITEEIRLVTKAEMRLLFPGAALWQERFLGWTKSFIVTRQ